MSTMDLRQALAGLLTLSMFIMLGNMVKKDHIDPFYDVGTPSPDDEDVEFGGQSLATVSHLSIETSKENGEGLKPCWNPSKMKETEQSNGFITFSLTNGPEYHLSQVVDAVGVARSLGATLVIPDIRSNKQGYRMNFGDVYDVEKFLNNLNGVVRVTRSQPPQASNVPTLKVPNRVSEDHIVRTMKPIFQSKKALRIESYFPSMNSSMEEDKKSSLNPLACKAMFETLHLQSEVKEVVQSMVKKLRGWSKNMNGQFIAVDLRSEMCGDGRERCYKAEEIGEFLKKVGINQETPIYVTQSRWHPDLEALRDIFPKTYTKESIIPAGKRGKFLSSEISEYEKVIDFQICSQSDVFVPSKIPSLFYANVAAMRIASGRNNILVPPREIAATASSASVTEFISPYVAQKTNFAYSCFC